MDTLLPPIFDEGFETFTPKEKAEKLVDVLLDMCGSPHMKKRGRERGMSESSVDDGTFSLNGRPYDAPRQVRIRPIVDIIDVEDEQDVKECDDGDYGASPERDNFEGAETSTGEEEEPAIQADITPIPLSTGWFVIIAWIVILLVVVGIIMKRKKEIKKKK